MEATLVVAEREGRDLPNFLYWDLCYLVAVVAGPVDLEVEVSVVVDSAVADLEDSAGVDLEAVVPVEVGSCFHSITTTSDFVPILYFGPQRPSPEVTIKSVSPLLAWPYAKSNIASVIRFPGQNCPL